MEFEKELKNLIKKKQLEIREKFNRHVSIQDLLSDRWETAKLYGFGKNSSCYKNVLIISILKYVKSNKCHITEQLQHSEVPLLLIFKGLLFYCVENQRFSAIYPNQITHLPIYLFDKVLSLQCKCAVFSQR